jgi:hypothetical protein
MNGYFLWTLLYLALIAGVVALIIQTVHFAEDGDDGRLLAWACGIFTLVYIAAISAFTIAQIVAADERFVRNCNAKGGQIVGESYCSYTHEVKR